MNRGTKIRTILGILTTINTILAVTDVTQFGNEKITFAYQIISVIVNAIVVGINTWYNNDYTPEACEATGMMRQMKAERKANYIGDSFYAEYQHDYEEEPNNRGGAPDEDESESDSGEDSDE